MQSAINVGNTPETTLVTAEALREMTITKDVLFERQRVSILEAFMSSMVRLATEQGLRSYTATLNPAFDPSLLGKIMEELKTLGYTVASEAKTDPKLGSFIALSVTW